MTVRVACIGMGDMGSAHARGFQRLEECDVVAVCDPQPDWASLHPVAWTGSPPPFFDDYRLMLEVIRPHAVIVSVPGHLHAEVALAALRAGCHVLLEKPITTTVADCDAILAEARRQGLLLQVGLVYRYSRLYREMADLVTRGPVGPVRLMWCKSLRQCFPPIEWFFHQERCGGTIVEKNCHHFDLFRWMIGSRPVSVSAFGGQHVYRHGEPALLECDYSPLPPLIKADVSTVDHAVINILYANGAVANLVLCMYLKPHNMMPEGLEVGAIGLNGLQVCAYGDNRLGTGGLGQPWSWISYDAEADHEGLGHVGCQQQRREFLACVRERVEPVAGGTIAREALLVALAAENSLRNQGRPVAIPPEEPDI